MNKIYLILKLIVVCNQRWITFILPYLKVSTNGHSLVIINRVYAPGKTSYCTRYKWHMWYIVPTLACRTIIPLAQGSFWVCTQTIRDDVTMWRCLSLVGHIPNMILGALAKIQKKAQNSESQGIVNKDLAVQDHWRIIASLGDIKFTRKFCQ